MGIALDHWCSPDGAVKRGGEEAREPARALVLDRIREVQAAAAWGLMREAVIEDHRAMLRKPSANRPVEDAPWEVARVRDMLDGAER